MEENFFVWMFVSAIMRPDKKTVIIYSIEIEKKRSWILIELKMILNPFYKRPKDHTNQFVSFNSKHTYTYIAVKGFIYTYLLTYSSFHDSRGTFFFYLYTFFAWYEFPSHLIFISRRIKNNAYFFDQH